MMRGMSLILRSGGARKLPGCNGGKTRGAITRARLQQRGIMYDRYCMIDPTKVLKLKSQGLSSFHRADMP